MYKPEPCIIRWTMMFLPPGVTPPKGAIAEERHGQWRLLETKHDSLTDAMAVLNAEFGRHGEVHTVACITGTELRVYGTFDPTIDYKSRTPYARIYATHEAPRLRHAAA